MEGGLISISIIEILHFYFEFEVRKNKMFLLICII
jgi:hypothetical protein